MSNFSKAIITKVRVRGYRSLEDVSVKLEPVTVLVGPNSSGKSSFLKSLNYLAQLNIWSQIPFDRWESFEELRTRTGQQPDIWSLEVDIESREPGLFAGKYFLSFKFNESRNEVSISIPKESCEMTTNTGESTHRFTVKYGEWVETVDGVQPKLTRNARALPLLSGIDHFAPMYEALTSIQLTLTNPQWFRSSYSVSNINELDDGVRINYDGRNAISVLRQLRKKDETLYLTVLQAISQVVPSITNVQEKREGNSLSLSIEESFSSQQTVEFKGKSMSDGTLRTLAILLALYQRHAPTLVMLEDPETAIHPGAAAVLVDAMKEAALRTQILITTHSPDLLTHFDVEAIRAVERIDGVTTINTITEVQRETIRDGLFTASEIHRIEGLRPALPNPEGAEENA